MTVDDFQGSSRVTNHIQFGSDKTETCVTNVRSIRDLEWRDRKEYVV